MLKHSSLAREVARLTPPGGLGFHGTAESVRASIERNGLDPTLFISPQRYISYYCFEPAGDPQQLIDTLLNAARVAVLRSRYRIYGPGENLPLLAVFVDPEQRGERSTAHRPEVRMITSVPKENILGLYTIPGERYRYDGSKGYFIATGFVRDVIEDIKSKLAR